MTPALRSVLVIGATIAYDLIVWDGAVVTTTDASLPYWLPPALIVAVHQCLWWRRSRPVAVFAIEAIFAMVSLWVPLWQPFAGLLVAVFAVAVGTPLAVSRFALVLVPIPILAHNLGQARHSVAPLQAVLLLSLLSLGVAVAAWALGRNRRRHSQRLRRWQLDQDELREQALRAERVELARELHDGVANTITAVLVQAAAARAGAAGDPQTLHGIEASARRAMEEIQATLRLMPRGTAETDGPSLDDLPSLLELGRAAGLHVVPTVCGRPRQLEPAASTAAYRAVQEGITNALKYAPPGTRCEVSLNWGPDELVIGVVDRPSGQAPRPAMPATGGRGLRGLADRVGSLGGVVESGAQGTGFRLEARLPVGAA